MPGTIPTRQGQAVREQSGAPKRHIRLERASGLLRSDPIIVDRMYETRPTAPVPNETERHTTDETKKAGKESLFLWLSICDPIRQIYGSRQQVDPVHYQGVCVLPRQGMLPIRRGGRVGKTDIW